MSELIMPGSGNGFVPNGFNRSVNRRSLKYAVQIKDEKRQQIVKCITVSVDIAGGMPPPAIKRKLQEKVIGFISNAYPGQLGLRAIIVGRVDIEI